MKVSFLLIPASLLLLFSSCNSTRDTLLPGISGTSGEILVVIEKHHWADTLGGNIRHILQEEADHLPQPEPLFSIIQIPPVQFGTVFQSHRNVLVVKTNAELSEPRITVRQDVWSRPQTVIDMEGPSDTALARYLMESGKQIQQRINRAERERLTSNYHKYQDIDITAKLRERHHLTLYIPRGYSFDVDSSDFAWLSLETPTSSQGIFIYTYPYTDPENFKPENLIRRRNTFLRRHVPGPLPGSFMGTEDIVPPGFREFMDDNRYFAELRGLWKLEGRGSMGGPFISLSTVDEQRNRVVTVEGYVYAPGAPKRELYRQVETIVYTLTIAD